MKTSANVNKKFVNVTKCKSNSFFFTLFSFRSKIILLTLHRLININHYV